MGVPGGAVMTMWIVSDIRASVLFDGHADYRRRPSFQDDANSPRRRGRRESDQPIRPVRKRFPETWATASLVGRPTGRGNGPGGAWASVCDPRHAPCRSMRVHRGHGCRDPARVAESTVDCADISLRIACACFRSPTGRGNAPRTHPVRVRIPAKAPAEATASTPPDPVRTSAGTGTMLRQVLSITGIRNRCSARFRSYSCGIRCQRRHPPAAILGRDGTIVTAQACTSAA